MSTASELLRVRAAWTDESAYQFLRYVVLPHCAKTARNAVDSAPSAAPIEPKVLGSEWMTIIQPDANELREASAIVELYSGVPFAVGQKREAAYRLRKLERSLES